MSILFTHPTHHPEVDQKYDQKVAFGYRHFPLGFHTEADEAAIAVECAREQNKFEKMHEILYENQKPSFLKI